MQWLADGTARVPSQRITELMTKDFGVYIRGRKPDDFEYSDSKLGVTEGEGLDLPYPMTLLWNPKLRLRGELVPVGFHLLNTWQVAAPLWDYKELACHVGTDDDRECTQDVVRDLRMPLYDTRLIFVKRCGDTKALIDTWREEEGDEKHAFLRALYKVKPLILALPVTWKGRME